ncbi:MAG TPA: extracellular solute-binding protein [Actinospica sp.]|nr:extracellular solute-binding protein [Actinospica sp.]
MTRVTAPRIAAIAATILLAATACSAGGSAQTTAQAGSGTGTITVWAHDGQPAENASIEQAVSDFNAAHTGVTAKLTLLPAATYTQTIESTPRSKLPDVLEYDGPTMSAYVYAGKLSPLTGLVASSTTANQTSSIIAQDTYPGDGKLYGVALINSGFGMYGNKQLLRKAGVTWPTSWSTAWTADEFQADLAKIAKVTPQGKALDAGENNFPGEFASYAYLPIVNSAGYQAVSNGSAQGNLNSAKVVSAVEQFASWSKYIDANTDGNAFSNGRVALSWTGHWMYPTYSKALGSDLVALPLPNFGDGAKGAQGSWAWGISSNSKNGKAGGNFLNYLMSDRIVSAYTNADGAPPATKSALAASALYKTGGPLNIFAQALDAGCGSGTLTATCVAVPRPVTPAYPIISQQFGTAMVNALKGQSVPGLLDAAVTAIDQAYSDNDNYGLK